MKALVWFRNDLRIDNNPALKQAFNNSDIVEAIFLYSQNQHIAHNEANVKIEFLIKNLFFLEERLSSLNVALTIIESNGFEEDPTLIKKHCIERSINKVFWNNQFGEDEAIRDKKVSKALVSKNVDVETFNDQIIYEPGSLKTGQGHPYSVFTPFKRKWIENFEINFLILNMNIRPKIN